MTRSFWSKDSSRRGAGGEYYTLKQAKRGGTFKNKNFASPASLDVLTPNNPITPFAYDVYRMLVHFEPGYLKPSENELGGSLAESWETSPDGLQITLKLRQGVKWHNKPPVNGRAFDMEDVLFSWERFAGKASQRVSLVNSVNPAAPVLSLTRLMAGLLWNSRPLHQRSANDGPTTDD